MAKTNINIRIDEELKRDAEELFEELGLNFTTAYTLFTKQALRERRIPFEISAKVPNAETIAAMEEAEDIIKHPEKYKSYTDVDEMLKELLA